MISKRVVVVGVVLYLCVLGLSFVEAGKPQPNGTFAGAGFTPPDFSNRDTATVQLGESRVFTAVCSCVRQPGTAPCYGSVILEMGQNFEFLAVESDTCAAAEGETCSAAFTRSFDTAGEFQFRVRCDEDDGTGTVQNPVDGVTITVEDGSPTCSTGETRLCPLQQGVCAGSIQTCTDGEWPQCNYGAVGETYEDPEESCDGLDNDCDGRVDFVDFDGDGVGICGGLGVIDELFLSEVNGTDSIEVYEYRNGAYEQVWSSAAGDTNGTSGGGEAGDLTGDGLLEIAIQRIIGSDATRLEVWAFNPIVRSWYRFWAGPTQPGYGLKVNEILDVDGDGHNELLVTDRDGQTLDVYDFDTTGLVATRTVQYCENPLFHATAADLDGDGLPEIFFQCYRPEEIKVHEFNQETAQFDLIASIPAPQTTLFDEPSTMVIDDMEAGDVNRDGVLDIVFCGNTGQVHVLTLTGNGYEIIYDSPPPDVPNSQFTQTCSIGDVTNDGLNDFFVVHKDAIQVFSHDGQKFYRVWSDGPIEITPGVGSSFVGDADNDGRNEFVWGRPLGAGYFLYESDEPDAADFSVTAAFGTIYGGGTIIVANLNPTNDVEPIDCDDHDPSQGAFEICGDGVDNDCDEDGEAEEGCDLSFCGDNTCGGEIFGEMCTSCPEDCGCFGPNCKHGCCGDGACGKLENATNCPVDCS